jgi:hypothetical protein
MEMYVFRLSRDYPTGGQPDRGNYLILLLFSDSASLLIREMASRHLNIIGASSCQAQKKTVVPCRSVGNLSWRDLPFALDIPFIPHCGPCITGEGSWIGPFWWHGSSMQTQGRDHVGRALGERSVDGPAGILGVYFGVFCHRAQGRVKA